MALPVRDTPRVLWTPPPDVLETTEIGRYLAWLKRERGLAFADYDELQHWSVDDLTGFWSSIWEFFEVRAHVPYSTVLESDTMPGAVWFPGARLNFAEHLLGRDEDADEVAVVAHSQTREPESITFAELREQVARARAGLVRLGVGPGDRVVAYLPNIPETLVAFAAAASLGAVWASCAPEFGPRSVVDRIGQLEPTVLLTVGGYGFRDRSIDRRNEVAAIRAELPSLRHVVHVPYGEHVVPDALPWSELLAERGPLEFTPVAFDHPLFVLFSSGTTGRPKAIVHGHGGILLELSKAHALSWDLKPGGRLLWFSTTSWMMWNALVAALLVRSSIVMVDGDPVWPDPAWQWRIAEETRPTFMGVSPTFLAACRKAGLEPGREHDLSSIEMFGTAGSPLPVEGYHYVYEQLGPDVLLVNGSGGTDVCSGIVGASPLVPVWEGEISARLLGVATDAFDEHGRPVVGELGELVITRPMPSMPVGLWGDEDGSAYLAAYFDMFPGVWRQGDWICFSERGSCVVTGRSDATLNRGGVRLGTGEFYGVIEELPQLQDSLVVHLEDDDGGPGELVLFVVLAEGVDFDDELRDTIARSLREQLSPRHVPDAIHPVPAIPRTMTGKKLETPVKRILRGTPVEQVASRDALLDPTALDPFVSLASATAQGARG
ncbi:MAG TPA: acetoacetate--CoA ligase [Gaiella sp.]|jgi:acetoacetyl-CoA synthetase|nr:acetoacetate--CoA ligase [Gaiella sp.]